MGRKKQLYLMVDTETANGLNNPYVYDLGAAVIDRTGKVYASISVVIYDIFRGERHLMETAYYANKIPMYERQIKNNERRIVRFSTAQRMIKRLIDMYNIKIIIAHNTKFDFRALNNTMYYITKGIETDFFPENVILWDTLEMARSVILTLKKYIVFCKQRPLERIYKDRITGIEKMRATAEILYQFIIGDNDFKEEHTGLADIMIEKEIFVKCLSRKKKMNRLAIL